MHKLQVLHSILLTPLGSHMVYCRSLSPLSHLSLRHVISSSTSLHSACTALLFFFPTFSSNSVYNGVVCPVWVGQAAMMSQVSLTDFCSLPKWGWAVSLADWKYKMLILSFLILPNRDAFVIQIIIKTCSVTLYSATSQLCSKSLSPDSAAKRGEANQPLGSTASPKPRFLVGF